MSDEQDPTQKPARPNRDHVALSEESTQKINKWFEQINSKKKIRVTRKDMVNWLIEKSPENLSSGDLSAIISKFYDEETFLRQLLRDVKRAKASGEGDSLEVIVRTRKTESKKEATPVDDET